jgi:hypothetical protein
MKERNDTPQRWARQTAKQNKIWDEYDQTTAPKIVRQAIAKGECSLVELYRILALARISCELEKTIARQLDNSQMPAHGRFFSIAEDNEKNWENYFFKSLSLDEVQYFGAFQHDKSFEVNLWSWGDLVNSLIRERDYYNPHGLSHFIENYYGRCLQHPNEEILERANPIFQSLFTTNNFFEFLDLSARLAYNLSNFPPTTRGSAAVTTWILQGVARERFNLTENPIPLLHDWMAFYETPEQYRVYYVLCATARYIKTIPTLYQSHQEFYDSLLQVLIKNPYSQDNLQEREKIWEKMQTHLVEALASHSLSSETRKNLETLQQGSLRFTKPSAELRQVIHSLETWNDSTDSDEEDKPDSQMETERLNEVTLTRILSDAHYPMSRFHPLIHFHRNTVGLYLSNFNNESLDTEWANLELLRTLPVNTLKKLEAIDKKLSSEIDPAPKSTPEQNPALICLSSDPRKLTKNQLQEKFNNFPAVILIEDSIFYLNKDCTLHLLGENNPLQLSLFKSVFKLQQDNLTEIPSLRYEWFVGCITNTDFAKNLNFFRKISFATWQDVLDVPLDILNLLREPPMNANSEQKSLALNLQQAILAGGVKIQDLRGLSLDEVGLIAAPEKIALYKETPFLRSSDLDPAVGTKFSS